jgi:Spy/CpxP family protein refolding chaperone
MMVTAKRARLTGMIVLAMMFAVGALTGAATMRVVEGDESPARVRGEAARRPDLFETLHLTPEQRVQVDAIMERRREEVDAFWKQHGPQLRAIMDSARAEMRTVLTPEQQAIEEKFRADRRRHYERHR